jgi:hypothetical protein
VRCGRWGGSESSQASAARIGAREAAERLGFNDEDAGRAGLIASELATNVVKHANRASSSCAGSPEEAGLWRDRARNGKSMNTWTQSSRRMRGAPISAAYAAPS